MMTLLFRELTTGRIGRAAYAKALGVQLALLLAMGAAVYGGMDFATDEVVHPSLLALAALLFVPLLWMAVVIQVKRVRDWGISGWCFVPMVVVRSIPVVGSFADLAFLIMFLAVPRDAFARAPAAFATAA